MKPIFSILGALSIAALTMSGCGGEEDPATGTADSGITVPDAEVVIPETDAGVIPETDAGDESDAAIETDAGGDDIDAGPGPSCTPKTKEELEAAHCYGKETNFCGEKAKDNGCGEDVVINCGCNDGLICNTSTNSCEKECTPLNANTAYAYYCRQAPNYWECGGKILRDDLCGGQVNVNCGGDNVCKNNTVCQMDPDQENYLRCLSQGCTPEPITDAKFCENQHSECGVATGTDSCGGIKTVNCGGCTGEELCVAQKTTSGSSTYVARTCEPAPNVLSLESCTETEGDTSGLGTSEVMLVEKDGGYLYSAPELIYAYTPSTSGTVTVRATPWNDAGYDLVLYAVDNIQSRTPIAQSNRGSHGEAEELQLTVTANTTYYLVVDGADWSSTEYDRGTFHITVDDGNCQVDDPTEGKIVISALYAGGNTGRSTTGCKPTDLGQNTLIGTDKCEIYHQDYIELHNVGNADVDVSGWTVFVSPIDSSTNWQLRKTIGTNKVIPPGGYFLIGDKTPLTNDVTNDIQDIPTPDLTNANLQLSTNGHKILIGHKDLTATNLKGTDCPTAEQGILFVFGGASVCGSGNVVPGAHQLYHSAACGDMVLTNFDVRADAVVDQHNNTTHPITNISPKPRNSASTPVTCAGN